MASKIRKKNINMSIKDKKQTKTNKHQKYNERCQ